MLINVDPRSGSLFAAFACKNGVNRCVAAVLFASALFCMARPAVAGPEAVITGSPQVPIAYTGSAQADGVASIGVGGRNAARQAAISDALRKAVASAGTHALQQNPDVQPARQGNRYSILREWESQGRYHVTASAEVVKGKFDTENAILVQIPKKKVVITQFDVANTSHVSDINNIYDGFPVALSGRLETSGRFLSVYAGQSIPIEASAQQREAIIQLAGETGAQLLISGIVVNAGIGHEKWSVGTPFDWTLKVPFGGYKKRHIEVEFSVFDGITGNRILLRRLDEQTDGDVMVGNDKPFGSSIFLDTEFGKATSRLIDSAVKEIQEGVENVPFSARIIKAEGKKVFIDAGGDSLLKPGDKLVAYASDPIALPKGTAYGFSYRAADMVALVEVKPQFSIGELPADAAKLGIKAGNIAMINFADQRDLTAKQIAAQQFAKAQQEAKAEAERVKAEQAAQAEAARIKAEQDAQAEAARIKEEKRAKVQAVAEAKAAKLKAQQAAKAARGSAAQQARARALAVRAKAAQKAKAQAAAEAAKSKAKTDTPKTDTPKADAPRADAPKADAPKADAPKADAPKADAPKADAPKADAPKADAPKADVSQDKPGEQKEPVQTEMPAVTQDKATQAVKAGELKENKKRKVLPPGEQALRGKTKSPKP